MSKPLSPDAMFAALRAEGCDVREYRNWRTRNRNEKGDWGPVNGVMMHHTATPASIDGVALCYNGYKALPGPLCQGVISRTGVVWLISAGRANHAGLGDKDVLAAVVREDYDGYPPKDDVADTDGNSHFYGFECENLGDGKDPWPHAQRVAMVRAASALCRAHEWSARSVIGHKEWQPGKIDPKDIDMRSFRDEVAECLKLPPGRWGDRRPLTLEQRVARIEAHLGL